jgi:hypothetical protein
MRIPVLIPISLCVITFFISCVKGAPTSPGWAGLYGDSVTVVNGQASVHDSMIIKWIYRLNDSTYTMCGGICGSQAATDSVVFVVHADNSITPTFKNGASQLSGYGAVNQLAGGVTIYLSWQGNKMLYERLHR